MLNEIRISAWSNAVRSKCSIPLRVELWNGQHLDFSPDPPRVTIRVPEPAAVRYLLSPSLYSLGRAYVEGAIEVSGRAADMIAVVNLLAANARAPRRGLLPLLGKLGKLGGGLLHTRALDAAAVRYHYDVSNAFYAAWLDPDMVYSCAYFENGDETLAVAQHKKIDHILAKLGVRAGHSLLDIGCGWGALAIRAAQRYGVRCVGITISGSQAALARERAAAAGVGHLVEIREQDYRDVRGSFDRITSVGMFEHVGLRQLPGYFRRIHDLLAPGGLAMNHGLTTTSTAHDPAPHGGGKFIQRYVFPHGELAHVGTVLRCMQEGGLEALDVENLRRHYARTCAMWVDNFERNGERIARLTDPKRYRIWQVYLAGCSHAFAHDWTSVYQVVCQRAGQDPGAIAWSRRYMYPGSEVAPFFAK